MNFYNGTAGFFSEQQTLYKRVIKKVLYKTVQENILFLIVLI